MSIMCFHFITIFQNYIWQFWSFGSFLLRILGPASLDFPVDPDNKESACTAGDPDSIPGLGRSPGGGNIRQHQHSCLENSMNGGPGELPCIGSHGVRHDRVTNTFTFRTCLSGSTINMLEFSLELKLIYQLIWRNVKLLLYCLFTSMNMVHLIIQLAVILLHLFLDTLCIYFSHCLLQVYRIPMIYFC